MTTSTGDTKGLVLHPRGVRIRVCALRDSESIPFRNSNKVRRINQRLFAYSDLNTRAGTEYSRDTSQPSGNNFTGSHTKFQKDDERGQEQGVLHKIK
jgi:hypothetical protein